MFFLSPKLPSVIIFIESFVWFYGQVPTGHISPYDDCLYSLLKSSHYVVLELGVSDSGHVLSLISVESCRTTYQEKSLMIWRNWTHWCQESWTDYLNSCLQQGNHLIAKINMMINYQIQMNQISRTQGNIKSSRNCYIFKGKERRKWPCRHQRTIAG